MTKVLKVGVMPGRITEVAIEPGTSAKAALALAGLTEIDGYELKLDGSTVDTTSNVSNGQLLLLTKKVKGNNDPRTVTDGEDTTIAPK